MMALRVVGKNGSALPGLMVEKLYPNFLNSQLDQLEGGVVIVTGTNGKTTTTKSLVYILEQCGLKVFTNPTGSNLTRGIYSSLIKYSSILGKLDYDIAVIELDEAYSRKFAKKYAPRLVLVLNVMRDQLDRYGEIDKTAEMIGETVSRATEGAVLNYDDSRVRNLKTSQGAHTSFYGINESLIEHMPSEDDFHGISIHSPAKHTQNKKPNKSKLINLEVELTNFSKGSAGFTIDGKVYHTAVKIAGIHNAFNLTAALATAIRICPEIEPQFMVPSMKNIPAAFGRGEVISIGDTRVVLALVKNPSGFRQSLESYDSSDYDAIGFAINDNYADGRDVSWLWDVDFKSIEKNNEKITGGTRGADMQLRLKYDEVKSSNIPDLKYMLKELLDGNHSSILIFCTYTSMLELRKIISQKTDVENIW